jgi:peptide/nickel transport system substrate-binding protein
MGILETTRRMMNKQMTTRRQHKLAYFLIAMLLLAACQIEGGVESPTTPGVLPTTPAETTPTSPPTQIPRTSGFRIGLLAEPRDLLPYHEDVADKRITSPISELLFPSPLLEINYTYTTTGILERKPSLANGDVAIRDVYVYLDEQGNIDAPVPTVITATDTLTTAQQPAIPDTDPITANGELTTTTTITPTTPITMTEAMVQELVATGEVTIAQQMVVTFRWNPALHWSDGEPLTAQDSVFAYTLARDLLLGEEAHQQTQLLQDYRQVDEHTTQAVLPPEFLDRSAFSPDYIDPSYLLTCWTPLPQHILQTDTAAKLFDFAWAPVGYGPYMIERREEGGIRFQRNPYYEGQPPQEEEVLILFLPGFEVLRTSIVGGSLDVAVTDDVEMEQFSFLSRDQELGLYNIAYVPSPIWEHLDFNLDIKLLQNINVRRAIAYGTNRQAMVDTIFNGKVAVMDSWIVPEHWATAAPEQLLLYPYNPDEANRLLDDVGALDVNGDGTRDPVSVNLLTTENSPVRAEIARIFQENMAAIGIVVNTQTVPTQQLYSPEGPLFQRDFHLAQFASIASSDLGGLSLWSCRAVPSEKNNWTGNNFAGWCLRDADQAIRTATTAQNLEERKRAYLTQQQLFTQELPALPLFQRLSLTLMAPNLSNVRPDPIAPVTWNITSWQKQQPAQ